MINRRWKRGDIFYVKNSDSPVSKGVAAIIVSDEKYAIRNSVQIVHLSTTPKEESVLHVKITSATRPSVSLCEHIKTVFEDRLDERIGTCTQEELSNINSALKLSLNLGGEPSDMESCGSNDSEIAELRMKLNMYKELYDELIERVIKGE